MSSIGRIVHVSPQDSDRFLFRLLFAIVSYKYLWSVGDIVYPTFRDAAYGHLDDNQEWLHGLTEATAEKMPYQLHQLIAIVLAYSLPTRADKEEFKGQISEGVARNNEEKDVAENIHREHEVRVRMTEYKTLKYVAHYLAFNGKMLKLYVFLAKSKGGTAPKRQLNYLPVMNRGFFEAVGRVVPDIMKIESEPSGGKFIVFSGDHRQILPILKDATRAETKTACFKRSVRKFTSSLSYQKYARMNHPTFRERCQSDQNSQNSSFKLVKVATR
ncbi:LOW QUALITY PROTEIN: Helitron helicase [Phytophthora megakarya]|uniref:ATP-dependent DNA helicase n=1 Tax=Phytophthora megakarya TaxID=4795 RepID=A0A225V2C4_9STRA|nr:LOW QUALITY PROTEIN: Helitron helicase [Phytophthora megakarya]